MKNYIIKAFKVNAETYKLFQEASKELAIQQSQLSRLLFNRALLALKSSAIQAKGYDKLNISIKELRDIR